MSSFLNLHRPGLERKLSFSYGTFGPSQTNCFIDFDRCVNVATKVQEQSEGHDDLYFFEGGARKILGVLVEGKLQLITSGQEFLQEHGIR
jgi:hypothetical protein